MYEVVWPWRGFFTLHPPPLDARPLSPAGRIWRRAAAERHATRHPRRASTSACISLGRRAARLPDFTSATCNKLRIAGQEWRINMHPIKSKSMEERLPEPASSLRSVSIPHLIASCCCLSVVVVATAVRLSGRRHRRPCLVAAIIACWIGCKRETMWRRRKLSAGWILVGRAAASRRYRGRFSEIHWNWPA
jgi:hypothetical protein